MDTKETGTQELTITKQKWFQVTIEYPSQPTEVLVNAMDLKVTEDIANKIEIHYLGNEVAKFVDEETQLEYRKFGRITLTEVKNG